MATYSGYSEQELADKARLIEMLALTEERRTQLAADFSNPDLHSCCFSFSAAPPTRCSDRVRRRFVEYVDFLFDETTFEEMIDQENTRTNKYTISASFASSGDCLDIQIRKRAV